MTGFGEALVEGEGLTVRLELSSVNHKHTHIQMRLLDEMADMEAACEALLRARLPRGAVRLSAKIDESASMARREPELRLWDRQKIAACMAEIRSIQSEFGLEGPVRVETLVAIPGVLTAAAPRTLDRNAILEGVQRAIDSLIASQAEEGRRLHADLSAQLTSMSDLLRDVVARLPAVLAAAQERMRRRIEQLAGEAIPIEEMRREIALLAERSSIQEEVDRLQSHLARAREKLDDQRDSLPTGRQLDFLAQEMLREANTMASKSIDAAVVHKILEIKLLVDNFREQVQNVQ